MPKVPGWVWAAVFAVAVTAEVAALHHRDGTATQHLRRILGAEPRQPWYPASAALVLGGCSWLAWHLLEPPRVNGEPDIVVVALRAAAKQLNMGPDGGQANEAGPDMVSAG